MSYCRWSCDNFSCDLYCYESVYGGWTTHVARSKVVGDIPEVPALGSCTPEEWLVFHRAQMDYLETAKRAPIGLEHDGEDFNDPDLQSFLERLKYLRGVGYNFPDYVLANVEQEIAEEARAKDSP